VRVFHDVTTEQAAEAVERLTERTLPIVWTIGDTRRVLDPKLNYKDQVLLLLYSSNGPIAVASLFEWVEHTHVTRFKDNVLTPAHRERKIEYDVAKANCYLTPVGVKYVEDNLPLTLK
jgi:hypothetical protein